MTDDAEACRDRSREPAGQGRERLETAPMRQGNEGLEQARECLESARGCLRAADFEGAERLLKSAIALDRSLAPAYELLGKLLYRDSRREEAASIYRAWLQALPSDPVASHLVASTSGGLAPARASDGFVASVFGRAAPEFDSTLMQLGYRAPQLVFERAAEELDRSAVALDVLDLGCGTGLCGEWFRPLARRLIGVDLATEMLEQAAKRKCYDELVCEELTAYLNRCADHFDVVTAADVFCYFGDLAEVFAAAARLLRRGGWFIFSVEELEPVPPDVAGTMLLEHGRYAHSAAYIERALKSAGLTPGVPHRDMLRFERGAPVQGLVGAARRG